MVIINKNTRAVQWNSAFEENWMGDEWVVVPKDLESVAKSCGRYCELSFDDDGNLSGITPTERPEIVRTYKLTEKDDIAALVIDLEYRTILLELGVTE